MTSEGYTRFVRVMRVLLPGAALMVFGLLFAWPYLAGTGGFIRPLVEAALDVDVEPMRMSTPRYVGKTANGERYTVDADTAEFDVNRPDLITLRDVEAALGEAEPMRLDAIRAIYDRDDNAIDLKGDVILRSPNGYVFETQRAAVLLPERRVLGRAPLAGRGPAGSLRSDHFVVEEGGDVLRFFGNVRAVLQERSADPRQASGSTGP